MQPTSRASTNVLFVFLMRAFQQVCRRQTVPDYAALPLCCSSGLLPCLQEDRRPTGYSLDIDSCRQRHENVIVYPAVGSVVIDSNALQLLVGHHDHDFHCRTEVGQGRERDRVCVEELHPGYLWVALQGRECGSSTRTASDTHWHRYAAEYVRGVHVAVAFHSRKHPGKQNLHA